MTSPTPSKDYGSLQDAEEGKKASESDKKGRSLELPSTSIRRSIKKKVPLGSFLWHQHSVLGMTVPDDHLTPPISAGPCPCCEIDPNGLTRRRRIFLFLLVFFVSTTLAVQVTLGHHGSFYALSVTILVVLPLVCHLKENLPTYSKWFMDNGIGPYGRGPNGCDGIRIEELILLLLFVLAPVKLWRDEHGIGIGVMEGVLWIWVMALVSELFCLFFKYYFGKYCCCCFNCCVPSTYVLLDDDEDDENDGKQENMESSAGPASGGVVLY